MMLSAVCGVVALASVVAAAQWPPQTLPYCNLSPAPIPPLSSASKAKNPELQLLNVRRRDIVVVQGVCMACG